MDDYGDADPLLAAALESGDHESIATALLAARVLIPIVAVGEESTDVDMAVPGLVGADGRQAMPLFSSYDALRNWRPDGRPVPMPGDEAVGAAIAEGYAAIVIDVAGPHPHIVEFNPAEFG